MKYSVQAAGLQERRVEGKAEKYDYVVRLLN